VATVYEVGTVGERVFIAMEFVAGQPLDVWLEQRQGWREVVPIFEAAARGLAAAHEAGIVHRDFKPGNVMHGDDGRVVVLDFGLAAPEAETVAGATDPDEPVSASGSGDRLTATHAVVGTPAYMAPEQHLGEPATPKSDQFALCVSLFEALYGARPFAGTSRTAVLWAIDHGEITVPDDVDVPRWLHRAVVRGLAADPDARWPDVPTLIEALGSDPVAKIRRRLLPLAFGGAVLGGAFVLSQPNDADPCAQAGEPVRAIWNADRRERTAAIIASSGFASAPYAGPRLLDGLDAYANALETHLHDACLDHNADPPVPGAAERTRCIKSRLRTLEATTDLLATPSEKLLDRALSLIPSPDGLRVCQGSSEEQGPQLAASNEARRHVEAAVARAKVLLDVGDREGGLKEAERALELAEASGDTGLRARARVRLARAHMVSGRYRDAEPILHRAVLDAERSDDAEAKTAALLALSRVLVQNSKHEQAQRMAELAAAAQQRFEIRPREWDADLEEVLGDLAMANEDWDGAVARFERMNEILADAEVGTMAVLSAKSGLAVAYQSAGWYRHGLALWTEVEQLSREAYGPQHRGVAIALGNRGVILNKLGDVTGSEQALRQSLEIREARDGPGSPSHAPVLMNLGALLVLRDVEAAIPMLEKARTAYTELVGSESAQVAKVAGNLGIAYGKLGRLDDGRAALERSVEILTKLRATGARLAFPLVRLAELEIRAKDCSRATEHLDRAAPLLDPDNAAAMRSWVRLHLARARCEPDPIRAREISERINAYVTDKELKSAAALLARLDYAGRIVQVDPKRAVALVADARSSASDEGTPPDLMRQADAFLAAHAPAPAVAPDPPSD